MRTLIISAYRPELGDPFGFRAVLAAHKLMQRLHMQGLHPRIARGKFHGNQELSVVVECYNQADTELTRTMRLFKQDYALLVSNHSAYLFNGDKHTMLGHVSFINNTDEEPTCDYTFMPELNSYLVVNQNEPTLF